MLGHTQVLQHRFHLLRQTNSAARVDTHQNTAINKQQPTTPHTNKMLRPDPQKNHTHNKQKDKQTTMPKTHTQHHTHERHKPKLTERARITHQQKTALAVQIVPDHIFKGNTTLLKHTKGSMYEHDGNDAIARLTDGGNTPCSRSWHIKSIRSHITGDPPPFLGLFAQSDKDVRIVYAGYRWHLNKDQANIKEE